MSATARRLRPAALSALLLLVACSSAYYSVMESFGVEKREILKDRVLEGRDDQEAAKDQFQTTLDAFKSATGFDGGNLEDTYGSLKKELDRCEDRAATVKENITSIEAVAGDLFREWEAEAETYASQDLRSSSLALLADTQKRYAQLMAAMRRSESKMEPVLTGFRDQVLFLKHNLNAQAIASLQSNVLEIEDDIAVLIRDMEASIREADAFIQTLG
ncbi:MAG: DUF2959 domain-containing protein [Planctomycetota bacterium]|jgi:hypothetical protein